MSKILVATEGGAQRFLGRQYGVGGQLEHFRAFREDLQPQIDRVKEITQSRTESKSEYKYLGSVSRVVIHDWITKQGKTWHQFATDKDLKAKFMVWYRTEFSKMSADTYRERSLAINRTTSRSRSSLGSDILSNYRKETAQ